MQLPSLRHSTGSEPTGLQLQARDKRQTNRKHSRQANSRNWRCSKIKGRHSRQHLYCVDDYSYCVRFISCLGLQAHSWYILVLGFIWQACLVCECVCVDKETLQPSILLGGTYFYPPVKLEACRLVSRHSGFAHKVNTISSGPIMCQMWTSPSISQMRKMTQRG